MASSSSLPGLWRLPELLRRRGGSPTRLFLAARMVAQRLRSPVPRGGVGGSTSSPVAHLGDFSGPDDLLELRHCSFSEADVGDGRALDNKKVREAPNPKKRLYAGRGQCDFLKLWSCPVLKFDADHVATLDKKVLEIFEFARLEGEMRHYLNCAGVNHQESGELPQ
uniref:Uncharacterized protein n=1 Tax=Leersia perrieri TaxID=77586 RepID=A0A0D9XUR4_9ORYZ